MNDSEEILLATVISRLADGVTIQLDGSDAPMEKNYKTLLNGRALAPGDRVAVLKQSGTYVVLGKIGAPQARYYLNPLPSSASLANCITQLNNIENILRSINVTVQR